MGDWGASERRPGHAVDRRFGRRGRPRL